MTQLNNDPESWVIYCELEGGAALVVASEDDWPPKTAFVGNV